MTDPGRERTGAVAARATDLEDRDLLQRIRGRDETALGELYDRYGGLVYSLALRILGDRELAEEILQDTFMRCWNGADLFDASRGHAAAWLMGVARNRAIDMLRGRQHQARMREREPLDAEHAVTPTTPDASEAVAVRLAVSTALEALSGAQRHALELAYYGGLTQAEIASTLGQPLGTVKTRMRDGLGKLRDLLRPLFEAGEST